MLSHTLLLGKEIFSVVGSVDWYSHDSSEAVASELKFSAFWSMHPGMSSGSGLDSVPLHPARSMETTSKIATVALERSIIILLTLGGVMNFPTRRKNPVKVMNPKLSFRRVSASIIDA